MQGGRNGKNPTVIMRTLKSLNSDIALPKKGQLSEVFDMNFGTTPMAM